jgi:hypothetical protein
MTCQKRYICDLCHDPIHDITDGIGLRWNSGNHIANVIVPDSEHHLCNRCIEGLKAMFADIDRMVGIYRELDGATAP